ncbi:MAG: DUF1501 domain-containing protein [Verrucomicrobiota bacterium]
MTGPLYLTRRQMLRTSSLGFGALALQYLLGAERSRAAEKLAPDLRPRPTHFTARARSVIMLMQNGGPSQMDLFDPKPDLAKHDGKVFETRVEMFQKGSEANKLLASPFEFRKWGRCGMDMAEVIPNLGSVADDLTMVRSMFTEHNNHTEALLMFNTGKIHQGRPTMGAWVSYALGTENQNLPAYIVLRDPEGYNTSGTLLWQSAWLPAIYRGTEFNSKGAPVLNLQSANPPPAGVQEETLKFLARLNEEHRKAYAYESDLESRIRNYELAARMQLSAGDALDLANESDATKQLYGLDNPKTSGYGLRCLMARRLVESGVRFVQIFPPAKQNNQPWDSHRHTKAEIEAIAAMTDQPSAALIKDLKQRGLLDQTIVIWAGEFGRLPVSQNGTGRDHNRNAFSLLLAGGGFRAGCTYGATDEVGYKAVENRVSVPDLHATILHLLGLDHDKVAFTHHGREETLTDSPVTKAKVIHGLLA